MANEDELAHRALQWIEDTNDPKALRKIAENARQAGREDVRESALRKLYAVSPEAEIGTLEHDVWQSIYALEGALTEERGKTTRLARTRQKIARDGERDTVVDLIKKSASEGYRMLVDRGWPELTFEAVALRHPQRFESGTLSAAKVRLWNSGISD